MFWYSYRYEYSFTSKSIQRQIWLLIVNMNGPDWTVHTSLHLAAEKLDPLAIPRVLDWDGGDEMVFCQILFGNNIPTSLQTFKHIRYKEIQKCYEQIKTKVHRFEHV